MDKKLDILTAGSWAIFDHLFEVEKLPKKGETVNILSPVNDIGKTYWGGCSYNSAVAAAKLGLKSGVQTVEGEDFVLSDETGILSDIIYSITQISNPFQNDLIICDFVLTEYQLTHQINCKFKVHINFSKI